jgi:transcriptional regulator with GAF, ATPase, and Fis domain
MSDITQRNTQLLSEIIQEISTLLSVEEIINKVYQNVNALMDAPVFAIGIYKPETNELCFPADIEKGIKLPLNYSSLDKTDHLSVRCFNSREEIVINDFVSEYHLYFPGKEIPDALTGENPEALIYLPLIMRNKAVGVLSVQSFRKNSYTGIHLDILRGLAVSVAGALERARLYERLEEDVKARTEEITRQKEEIEHTYLHVKLLSEIGKQIISSLSVEKIIETAYENINQLMDASSFWIGIYNSTMETLDYPLGIEKGKFLPFAFYDLSDDERLPVWSFKNQKEAFVNDYLKEYNNYIPDAIPPMPIAGDMPESSIWLPLISKDKKSLGVITIQSFSKNAYTEYHLDIVRNLAVFTSIALENALMYESVELKVIQRTTEVVKQKEEIEKTYENVKLLSEIGQQITSCLSVEKIIETAYESINKLMEASVFWIGIYQEKDQCIHFPGGIEKGEKVPLFTISLKDVDKLAIWCFENQKSVLINDLRMEFRNYLPHLTSYGAVIGEIPNSIIYLPLVSKTNRKVGVITVQSFNKNAYSAYQVNILKSLAVFVDIALENALMYEQVEQKVILRTAQVVKQKEELEEKNKDITDSINYAKKIQEALLPPLHTMKELFPDSFIFFRPRDIVSGDFYWFAEKNGRRIIAAVDCTGHGVPGAFMSMIGNSFLNEIVNERGIVQPNLILGELRKLVIRSLKQDELESASNDGMDISLLSFLQKGNDTEVEWAGANNPLWMIRKGAFLEWKPDKHPISYFRGEGKPFTSHKIQLQPGDSIFLFTDGYADQFGGPKGKKFKYKQLQEVLLAAESSPMASKEQLLLQSFSQWRGSLEQVDDVLVVGIRV